MSDSTTDTGQEPSGETATTTEAAETDWKAQARKLEDRAKANHAAAEKAAEQVFLFSAHVHAQEACQQEKALGHGGKQEYAAGEQAKQGGREKGGPPVRIQREKLIGRNGGAYSAEGGDEHRSTKGAAPGEKGEYSY